MDDNKKPPDANDVMRRYGVDELRRQIDASAVFDPTRPTREQLGLNGHAEEPTTTAPEEPPPIEHAPEFSDPESDLGPTPAAVGVRLKSVVASSVQMRAIKWMWPGRFAIGKLGLIGGMPDMGKGLITYSMIACITAGPPLPCGEGMMPRGNVILLTAEDDIEDTVVPRLAAAGADLDRVHIIQMAYEQNGKERMFNLSTDLDALRAKIEEVGNVVLIIIDPLSAYVGTGKLNTSSTTDVRGLLAPVVNLATAHKTSAIGIMHFNKKGDVMNAMLRIADSLAYVAAARHVYVVVNDVEVEDRRVFVKAKNNLSPDKKALTYTTGAKMVGFDEELQKEIWAPFVQWGVEHVNVTATEAMQAEAGAGNAHAKKEAKAFLLDRLEAGPVKADDLSEEADQAGISKATLRRAKKDLNVRSHKEQGKADGKWMWELPAKPRQQYQEEP